MELDALLAPLSGASPCGDDLSFSSEFDLIQTMRRHDDATLDQGEWITPHKVADWPGVATTCAELLQNQTKDLRVAMWLTEAWAMTRGYAGLAQGLQLCTDLCQRYWADLHPLAEHGDHEERIGNIAWLLQKVVSLSDHLPVLVSQHGQTISLLDHAGARQLQAQIDRDPDAASRLPDGKLTLEHIQRTIKDTPARQLLTTLDSTRQCLRHLQNWQSVVDHHLGSQAPGFVQAREALEQAIHAIERIAKDAGALPSSHSAASNTSPTQRDVATGDTAAPATSSESMPMGPLLTRAQALQQLREVAAFFRRTEPHSPVAYLAEKAVKWGDMPLHEWLRQVIKDHGAMNHLEELLGLPDPDWHNTR